MHAGGRATGGRTSLPAGACRFAIHECAPDVDSVCLVVCLVPRRDLPLSTLCAGCWQCGRSKLSNFKQLSNLRVRCHDVVVTCWTRANVLQVTSIAKCASLAHPVRHPPKSKIFFGSVKEFKECVWQCAKANGIQARLGFHAHLLAPLLRCQRQCVQFGAGFSP